MTTPAPHVHATDDQFDAVAMPTPWTVRMRTFIPWQLVRFLVINLRMLRVIARGHQ